MIDGLDLRTLQRALEIVATKEQLAKALEVSVADLEAYLQGTQPIPNRAFMKALDIVASGKKDR